MKFSYEDIKKILINNQKELNILKKPYKQLKFKDDNDFLNWFLPQEISFFDEYGFIEIEKTLIKRNKEILNINEKFYIRYKIIHEEKNINLITLNIGTNFLIFETINEENLNFFNTIEIINNETIKCFYEMNKNFSSKREIIFHKTQDDWYSSFIFENDNDFENNEMYIKLTKEKEDTNLDKWKIKIEGTDDYSMSKIFLSESEADLEWNNLLKLKYINKENLKEFYFSN